MGTLERLQKSMLAYLRGLADLKHADIYAEGFENEARTGKAEGLCVEIQMPMPVAASKYAAGPTFSGVEISVSVLRYRTIAAKAPSLLTVCEMLSRALHNWNPPLECGYGKVCLSQNNPWKRADAPQNSSRITLQFNAQSVLS